MRRSRLVAFLLLQLAHFGTSQPNDQETQQQQQDSPEGLFRKTVKKWQSQRTWMPWTEFTLELQRRFEQEGLTMKTIMDRNGDSNTIMKRRLEIIGAFEEGILIIERAVFEGGQGDDPIRDRALSKLYTGYGKALSELHPKECIQLAMDPHTLLIGAETVKEKNGNVPPSNFLCVENAENSLRNAATLDATNAQAEKLLQAITQTSDHDESGGSVVHKRKPKEFVAELFDSFADTFDQKLESLQYQVPKLVGELAQTLLHERKGSDSTYHAVLDAGCGTGLAGRFLRPLVTDQGDDDGIIVGVDASQKMLDLAAKCTRSIGCGLEQPLSKPDDERPLYDSLLVLDLEDMTLDNTLRATISKKNQKKPNKSMTDAFDLVVAADVLVYFGSLEKIINVFSKVSDRTSGAYLIFSCERATEEEAPLGWRLLPSGRFAHTKQHAVDVANKAGYELVAYQEIVPRMEKDEPVKGHLFGFQLVRQQNSNDEL